jgi:FdrA protein
VDHEVLDLGDDEYTASLPHPMIDPSLRAEEVARTGSMPDVGVILVDLVLGHGASTDPASSLAEAVVEAIATASAEGRSLYVVGSVCGTDADPQDITRQSAALRRAGVLIQPSAAAAARLAVDLVRLARSSAELINSSAGEPS